MAGRELKANGFLKAEGHGLLGHFGAALQFREISWDSNCVHFRLL
jgi:hypothetical protein